MKTNKLFHVLHILVLTLFLSSCLHEKDELESQIVTKTIAVVLPMQDGLGEHWKRTAELYTNELRQAQFETEQKLEIRIEFHDENTENLKKLITDLCNRDDIDAIIGGLNSANASIMAAECSWQQKNFFTLATAESLIRSYADDGYLWAMTETDITQCEVLLSRAESDGAKSVALITNEETAYGKTFVDWFAFQAQEFGITVKGLFTYTSDTEIQSKAKEAIASGADAVICAPAKIEDVLPIKRCFEKSNQLLLFSDMAFGTDVLQLMGNESEGIEGVAFFSNPESGFDVTYRTFFNTNPTTGEAQFYDALLLAGYGLYYQMLNNDITLRQALRKVVDGKEPMSTGWMSSGIATVFSELRNGHSPNISGASGSLDFDAIVYTNVLSTTYCHYKVYGGQYLYLGYYSSDGSNRTESTTAGWNWKAENMQDFDDVADISYPELDERWALLVASSDRWEDYRFQADVLAMYQLLKKSGYDDEHIVLIMEDNIAFNTNNPEPGVVKVKQDGENLYYNVKRDYRISDLSENDISDILCGRESDKLHSVIKADSDDNIFIFWSGHGIPGVLAWGYSYKGITADMAKKMFSEATFRKCICFIETCYSGSIASKCTGIPGLLFFTAANELETSKADVFNSSLNVWMTNRFTLSLRTALEQNPSITLHELYYTMFRNTVGSHVMIYNNDNYGNIFRNKMSDFLLPQ